MQTHIYTHKHTRVMFHIHYTRLYGFGLAIVSMNLYVCGSMCHEI